MANSKVVKAGVGYTIGNYLLKGLSFFTIPIFSRLLTTSDYGIVNIFGSYESILFVLIGVAIHTSFKNARYKYKYVSEGAAAGKDYNTYVTNAYLFICASGLIWLAVSVIFRNQLGGLLKLEPVLVMLLVVNSTANAIVTSYNSNASLNYQYKKYLAISFFNAIGSIVISLFLIFFAYPEKKYLARILGTVIPITIAGIYVLVMQLRTAKPHTVKPMLKWGVKYSLPIVPHGISQIILSSFDRIMINSMISSAAAGLYSFAYNIFIIIQVTAASIDTVWNTWFYERRYNNDLRAIKKISSIYILFLLAFSVFVMFISPELVLILGGAKYTETVYCVIPVVAGGFFAFLYNIPATVEYYHEKTRYIAVATTLAAVINIVLNYIFIKKYGYIAAAYTTLATYILYFLFHLTVSVRIEKKSLFSLKIIAGSVAGILAAAAGSLLLMKIWIARYAIAIAVFGSFVLYVEKKYKMISKVKNKFMQKIKA